MPPHIFASDRGWAAEWNSNSGQEGNNFTPIQETTGPDWNDICNKISFALISPYSDLVNPDNTLTQQGEHVKGCIQNGISWCCSSIGLSPNCNPFKAAYVCTARRMWRCNKLWSCKPWTVEGSWKPSRVNYYKYQRRRERLNRYVRISSMITLNH